MLKPAISFIFFQQRSELGQKILIPLRVVSSKAMIPQFAFETPRTARQCSMNAEEILALRVGFQYSAVCCFDCVTTQAGPRFVGKRELSKT
jgi:hypothetical protein